MKKIALSLALVGTLVVASAVVARAGTNDAWITTKAQIVLLTMDGFNVSGANVDTVDGKVTLHGKVATAADRARVEQTVRTVKGVTSVNNLLQVVTSDAKEAVATSDADVKTRVEASLKTDVKMKDVNVASVNKGVVLLSGKTESLDQDLRAIQNAYSVSGVRRVASELETIAN
jgi:osmotically-inducible protein OsmY